MRAASARFQAQVGHWNRWETVVDWSNDGGQSWLPATFLSGNVVRSFQSQIHWKTSLRLAGVELAADGVNAFSTQIRIRHGLPGELLPFGQYKVTEAGYSSDDRAVLEVKGSSHEEYLLRARFVATRTFKAQRASTLAATLIREVIPSASIAWEIEDTDLPRLTEARERWPLIDGDASATSIARALGGRIYAGPSGNWIARPTPTLYDAPVWEAAEGGVLLSHGETLSDNGVYNIIVASGQSTDSVFRPGVAMDLDPNSPTYVKRPVTEGGFGDHVRFYTSELLTSSSKAQKAAEAMLAPYLGLRQQITFSQAHNPLLEPGDVGIVYTINGPRSVLLDEVTYDLLGAPLSAQTRTTATTLVGDAYVAPEETGDS